MEQFDFDSTLPTSASWSDRGVPPSFQVDPVAPRYYLVSLESYLGSARDVIEGVSRGSKSTCVLLIVPTTLAVNCSYFELTRISLGLERVRGFSSHVCRI